MKDYTEEAKGLLTALGYKVFTIEDKNIVSEALRKAEERGRKTIEKELMAELRDPCGTIWERAKKLQDKYDALVIEVKKSEERGRGSVIKEHDNLLRTFIVTVHSMARGRVVL